MLMKYKIYTSAHTKCICLLLFDVFNFMFCQNVTSCSQLTRGRNRNTVDNPPRGGSTNRRLSTNFFLRRQMTKIFLMGCLKNYLGKMKILSNIWF